MIPIEEGGDRLKFSDVIVAVGLLILSSIFIAFPLQLVLVSGLGIQLGNQLSFAITPLLAALVLGYVYGKEIVEARRDAITKIAVLGFAVFVLFNVTGATSDTAIEMAREGPTRTQLESLPAVSLSSACDWHCFEQVALHGEMFIFGAVWLALVPIGLFVGSKLRQP